MTRGPWASRPQASIVTPFQTFVIDLTDADALFVDRHREQATDLVVALGASRAFLAAGAIRHAVRWLGLAAERADELGRAQMSARLRAKQASIGERLERE